MRLGCPLTQGSQDSQDSYMRDQDGSRKTVFRRQADRKRLSLMMT